MDGQVDEKGKNRSMNFKMKLQTVTALFIIISCLNHTVFAQENPYEKLPLVFQGLAAQLVADGFEEGEIINLFSNKKLKFDKRIMPRKITHNEAKLHYDIFLQEKRIDRAKDYLNHNKRLLDAIEREYGIPKEVKVAILLVETDLGRYLGSGLAINTLASMAVADDLERIRPYLPKEYQNMSQGERKKIVKRMKSKARWAYSELKSLIIYATLNNMDIFSIRGSIFGAIGLCQFMPSNALKFGVDYDKDGKVDLFSPADALASMANYLKYYGWRQDLAMDRQLKVIMHYNHSTPYARTVIKVAEKVKS